jgi:hypothetical protein
MYNESLDRILVITHFSREGIVRMIRIESKVRVVVRVHREWNAKTAGGCD